MTRSFHCSRPSVGRAMTRLVISAALLVCVIFAHASTGDIIRTTYRTPVRSRTTTRGPELVTDAELKTLTEELLSKDNKSPFRHVAVNYQGRTYSSGTKDEAPLPLFTVNETAAFASPTIAKMRLLYNNYELDTMTNEYVTAMERTEENNLIDALLATPLMRHAMKFLQQKGRVTANPETHRELLKRIWFNMYSRGGGRIGSSAFEHVFLAEIKNKELSGLHNWIYFSDQEKAGNINYMGYTKKLDFGNKGSLAKVRISFNGINKPVNSMFIGTSPELEVALYTVCFELRANVDCPIQLNNKLANIKTYAFTYRGKNSIGSAFPEI